MFRCCTVLLRSDNGVCAIARSYIYVPVMLHAVALLLKCVALPSCDVMCGGVVLRSVALCCVALLRGAADVRLRLVCVVQL